MLKTARDDATRAVRRAGGVSLFLLASILCSLSCGAPAMVGNAPKATAAIARHVVLITGSGGTFCTGSVIARDLVLTAGHCVDRRDSYKLVQFEGGKPVLLDVVSAVQHPQFNLNAFLNHRATADVALMKLANPLPDKFAPARVDASGNVARVGDRLVVAGFGVSVRGDGKTGGTLRMATLAVTGSPGPLQVRLVDPATNNAVPGLGACTGDSGSPAFALRGEVPTIVGLVSWSTAPGNLGGCGGLTGLTPLMRYRSWIVETAAGFHSSLSF